MSDTYIHPKALVETDQIGDDTKIWAFAHIMAMWSSGLLEV